jgi:hypothetical protein
MNKFKNVLLTVGLLSLTTLPTFAEEVNLLSDTNISSEANNTIELQNDGTFVIGTWSPDTKSGTISGYELQGNGMIGVSVGKKNFFSADVTIIKKVKNS